MAEAGVNLRGFSAAAIGDRFVAYLAVDSAPDANKIVSVIEIYDASHRPTLVLSHCR